MKTIVGDGESENKTMLHATTWKSKQTKYTTDKGMAIWDMAAYMVMVMR